MAAPEYPGWRCRLLQELGVLPSRVLARFFEYLVHANRSIRGLLYF